MSGKTIFPSNPCYLPIYEDNPNRGLERYTKLWRNFIWDSSPDGLRPLNEESIKSRIKKYNGTIINDIVVFETEQDKVWFILKWS